MSTQAPLKSALYEELKIKNRLLNEGIRFDASVFRDLGVGGEYQEQLGGGPGGSSQPAGGRKLPRGFSTPLGFRVDFIPDPRSHYRLEEENGRYFVTRKGNEVFPVAFFKRPGYYGLRTSDGSPMAAVGTLEPGGTVRAACSGDCALRETGETCLFCGLGSAGDMPRDAEPFRLADPARIAETYRAAVDEGVADHLNVTGGLAPGRRELAHYIAVAEAVRRKTGGRDFNGTAVIGAPPDLSVIDRFKEAGYRTLAINLEVWDKNLFRAVCPGKARRCGGWEHWVKAIEYAGRVFGFGNARTGIVGGLELKTSALEGVEYFASKGIPCLTEAWRPDPASGFKGHRAPESEWHWDLAVKSYQIFRRNGITLGQLKNVSPSADSLVSDLYRIEDGLLPAPDGIG